MHKRRPAWTGVSIALKLEALSKVNSLPPFARRAAIHVGLVEDDVGAHVCWPGGQHLLLAVNQIAGVEGGQFKSVTVRDRIGRASLYAISAKNAAVVVDVVNLRVALGATDAVSRRYFRRPRYRCSSKGRRRRTKNRPRTFPIHFRRAATRALRGNAPRSAPP